MEVRDPVPVAGQRDAGLCHLVGLKRKLLFKNTDVAMRGSYIFSHHSNRYSFMGDYFKERDTDIGSRLTSSQIRTQDV